MAARLRVPNKGNPRASWWREGGEAALEWIERAVQMRPDLADLQYRLAICLACLDRVDEAKQALEKCECKKGEEELRKRLANIER